MRFPNRSGQGRLLLGDRNKMDVVRHQAPSQNLDTEPIKLLGYDIEVRPAITVVAEYGD